MGAERPRGTDKGGQEDRVPVDDGVVQETGICGGERSAMLQYITLQDIR
jgi:hypothetical protein